MLIRITKSQDKLGEDLTLRSKVDDYNLEIIKDNESLLTEVISISEIEEQRSTEPIDIKPFEDMKMTPDDFSVVENISIFPKKILTIFSKSDVLNVIRDEQKTKGYIKLIINSESPILLELDWEKLLNDSLQEKCSLFQKRVTETDNKKDFSKSNYLNTLMLLSYSNKDYGGNLHKIFNDFSKEATQIMKAYFSNLMRDKDKPNIFTIARYINRDSIKMLPFNSYDVLHISGHGLPRKIGFEKVGNSDFIDWFDAKEINYLRKDIDNKYKVIFLATCNGANNLKEKGSFAFELIKNGMAEFVIAFKDEAGSEISIPKFAYYFYDFLMKGRHPEKAYYETMIRISKIKEIRKLKPIFYSNYE